MSKTPKPASSNDDQGELVFNDARLWTVTFTYRRYVRWRGVMIEEQVRDIQRYPALTEPEARRRARDWLYNQFMREYDGYHRDIANITAGRKLTKPSSLHIQSAVPY